MSQRNISLLSLFVLVSCALGRFAVSPQYGLQFHPTIASCPSGFVVAWSWAYLSSPPLMTIWAKEVTPGGDTGTWHDVGDCFRRGVTGDSADVAFDGTTFLIVWREKTLQEPPDFSIGARFCLPDGSPVGPVLTLTSPVPSEKTSPSVAFNGSEYLVVWRDTRTGQGDIYGVRISPISTPGELDEFKISSSPEAEDHPRLSSAGGRWLVAWERAGEIRAAAVEGNGNLLPEFVVTALPTSNLDPEVSTKGTKYLVTWRHEEPVAVYGIRCLDTDTLASKVLIRSGPGFSPSVAFESYYQNYVSAVATSVGDEYSIAAQRVGAAGMKIGPEENVFTLSGVRQTDPDVAFCGERFLVVWVEWGWYQVRIWGEFVTPWQEHFYSRSALATAYNQGRSLWRDPVTTALHKVYESGDSVLYSYSTDRGEHWSPYECVDADGTFPCVVCENQGANPVWVCYRRQADHAVVCKARTSQGIWQEYVVFGGCPEVQPGPPSISLAYMYGPSIAPRLYVAFSVDWGGVTTIEFRVVELGQGVTYSYTADAATAPDFCKTPSVAATPGDEVHLAWNRNRVIYYRRWLGGQWSDPPARVSRPSWPVSEPAYHPSLEAYGEYVYCTWRGPEENQLPPPPGDVWRAWRRLPWPPEVWEGHADQSRSLNLESDFPVMTTDFVTVWHEQVGAGSVNSDIWAKFVTEPEPRPLFTTPQLSQYPDVASYWDIISGFHCLTTWTEELNPGMTYEVMSGDWTSAQGFDGWEPGSYYAAMLGDSVPSPYCLGRDGWRGFQTFRVDSGSNRLTYRLPYLSPNRSYALRLVAYHEGRSERRADVMLDSGIQARVVYRPRTPETLWVRVPQRLYRDDACITLDIRPSGVGPVTLAGLKLFQVDEWPRGQGGGQAADGQTAAGTCLRQNRPNPFSTQTAIPYQLSHAGEVDLALFDVSGRVVRRLGSGAEKAGAHVARWDGRDDRGLVLPAGVYLCRLAVDGTVQTRRLVITR